MNTRHYHTPSMANSTRARCPVCHEAVYSQAGIHPQCAIKLYDPPRPKGGPTAPKNDTGGMAEAPENLGGERGSSTSAPGRHADHV